MPDLVEPAVSRFNDFLLDKREGLFRRQPDGRTTPIQLGSRALRILCLLVDHHGETVSQREIMDTVWPNVAVEPNNLTVQISALRRVLDTGRGQASCIQNVPGRGYRFVPVVAGIVEPQDRQAKTTQAVDDHASGGDASDALPEQACTPPAVREAQEPTVHPRSMPRSRPIVWTAASCLAAVLAVAGIWYLARTPSFNTATPLASPPSAVSPTERPRLSLVVLPFDTLGGDVGDHAADAIVDDLTTELSRYAGLRLTARNSAFTYKGKPIDIKAAGRDFGVRYAVEGSVRQQNRALAVNVQLVSAETGEQFWAERFTIGGPDGADATVDTSVRLIGFLVQRRVFEMESARSLHERPDSVDATDALIRAYALYNMPPSPQKHEQLLALYERAVALNPSSAAALGGLADTLLDTLPVGGDDPATPFKLRRAEELLNRASLLDPNELRIQFPRIHLLGLQGRCAELISVAERTIEAHPVLSGAYQWLGICLLREGRPAEAMQWLEQAIRTNPRTPQIDNRYRLLGAALMLLERYDEAVSWSHRALAANPNQSALTRANLHATIAAAHALSGNLEAARLSASEAKRLWPTLTARGYPQFRRMGNPVEIEQIDRIRDGLCTAGIRDHADEDADAGVASDAVLHTDYEAPTPVSVPGARTIRTFDLATMLGERRPLVLDTTHWGGSLPGAVALWGAGIAGSLSDEYQDRLRQKLQQLTAGNIDTPVVTVGWNAERYQARNLALRLVALGYTEVYWYRGGREAWLAAGLPVAEVTLQDW